MIGTKTCAVALLVATGACVSPRDLADESLARTSGEARARGADAAARPAPDEDARVAALLQDGLGEDEAARLALLLHRGVQARFAELGVATANLATASLWANPVLKGDLYFLDDGTEIDLGLSQSLYDALLLPLRKAKSGAELRAVEARVVRQAVDAACHARRAHAAARAAWRELELVDRQLAAARSAAALQDELEAAGNTTPAKLAAQQAETARREADRADAERAWFDAREDLNRATGLWGARTGWTLAEEGDVPALAGADLEHVEARCVRASLDLAQSRALLEAQAQAAGVADWQGLLPHAELGVVAQKPEDSSSFGLGPSFAVGLPLVDGGASVRAAAQAQLLVLAADHWALAVEVRSAARTFRERLRGLDLAERHARESLLPAERALVVETLRSYNAMQVGPFDVLRARMRELDAERRVAGLAAQARMARIDLDELLAGSFSRNRLEARASGHARGDASAVPAQAH